MKIFYGFRGSDNKGIIYINKENIISFRQIGIGMGSEITMTNGITFQVAHNEEQILNILGEKEEDK